MYVENLLPKLKMFFAIETRMSSTAPLTPTGPTRGGAESGDENSKENKSEMATPYSGLVENPIRWFVSFIEERSAAIGCRCRHSSDVGPKIEVKHKGIKLALVAVVLVASVAIFFNWWEFCFCFRGKRPRVYSY